MRAWEACEPTGLNGLVLNRDRLVPHEEGGQRDRLRPQIDCVFAFEGGKAAYLHQQSSTHFGKIVISV